MKSLTNMFFTLFLLVTSRVAASNDSVLSCTCTNQNLSRAMAPCSAPPNPGLSDDADCKQEDPKHFFHSAINISTTSSIAHVFTRLPTSSLAQNHFCFNHRPDKAADPGTDEAADPGTDAAADPGTDAAADPGTDEAAGPLAHTAAHSRAHSRAHEPADFAADTTAHCLADDHG